MAHLKSLPSLKFVLDVHLAKLARHLRMVGLDSLWRSDYSDPELLKIAKEEGRVLLTRDRELHDMTPEPLRHYVLSTDPTQQLKDLLDHFSLWEYVHSHRGFLTRCLQCNSFILPARAEQLEERLPASVREQHDEFFFCPYCERIYWKGSHFDRMKAWVDQLQT
jgi:uncharacterized protein